MDLSDLQIADLLYAGAPRTPAGFYAESAPPVNGPLATYHVQNTQLGESPPRHELCSDDWNQALAWSEAAASSGGSYEQLLGNSDTPHYFQFERLRPGVIPVYVRARVYKCAYLDRGNVDLTAGQGEAGSLNQRPIDAASLQVLSEYLWQFTPYNNDGNAVLRSAAVAGTAGPAHELIMASLDEDDAGAGCDRVSVMSWRHSVRMSDGALQLQLVPLWSFTARRDAGGARSC